MEADDDFRVPTVGSSQRVPVQTNHSYREQAADNTCRPDYGPSTRPGTHFEPLNVPESPLIVRPLPSTLLKLFQLFLPETTVQQWVDYTNNQANAPATETMEGSRQSQWNPTSVAEIYIWIGIWIYMISHKEYRFEDFWRVPKEGEDGPSHSVIKYMSYDRFFLLKRRLRIDDPDTIEHGIPAPYSRVNEWANSMMEAAVAAVVVGSYLAVDEGMILFEGQSKQKLTIKNKPTDTGLKVWLLATQGYLLRWIWHTPGAKFGPVGIERQFWKKPSDNEALDESSDNEEALNPTQGVVVALVQQLRSKTHHIFLDNLFSSPHLFRALRALGHGATGTARTNSGMYRRLVEAKRDDKNGKKLWHWGHLEHWPTEDNQVSPLER
jgi:hypothetical protein